MGVVLNSGAMEVGSTSRTIVIPPCSVENPLCVSCPRTSNMASSPLTGSHGAKVFWSGFCLVETLLTSCTSCSSKMQSSTKGHQQPLRRSQLPLWTLMAHQNSLDDLSHCCKDDHAAASVSWKLVFFSPCCGSALNAWYFMLLSGGAQNEDRMWANICPGNQTRPAHSWCRIALWHVSPWSHRTGGGSSTKARKSQSGDTVKLLPLDFRQAQLDKTPKRKPAGWNPWCWPYMQRQTYIKQHILHKCSARPLRS